jgi:hypothetical protein
MNRCEGCEDDVERKRDPITGIPYHDIKDPISGRTHSEICTGITHWHTNPHAAHLSRLEQRCAAHFLKVAPREVLGPISGTLVGECPGEGTRRELPLFPHPKNSAGGRLLAMSGLSAAEYLGRLYRFNLFVAHQPQWRPWMARERALLAHAMFRSQFPEGHRVVLCGQRVGAAFGFTKFWELHVMDDISYVCVPHPSGRNRAYNNPNARVATRAAVQWAADLLESFAHE